MSQAMLPHYPGESFILGLHAFALEEADRCAEAVRTAEAALTLNPSDAWAVHALAHGLYESADFDRGVTRAAGGDRSVPRAELVPQSSALARGAPALRPGRVRAGRADVAQRVRADAVVHRRRPARFRVAAVAPRAGRSVAPRALAAVHRDRPRAHDPPGPALPRRAHGDGAGRGRGLGGRRAAPRDDARAGRQGPDGPGRRRARAARRGLHAFAAGDYARTIARLEAAAAADRRAGRAAGPSATCFTTRSSRRASEAATPSGPAASWPSASPGGPTTSGAAARRECSVDRVMPSRR